MTTPSTDHWTKADKEGQPAPRPRVLVAEDNRATRQAIAFILGRDFDVTAVENGALAVAKIQDGERFDVVTLDINMPVMTGIEAMEIIKRISPETEVLLLSAISDVNVAKQALKAGAYDYIDKPIQKEVLRAAVQRGVERHRRTRISESAQEQLEFTKAQLIQSGKLAAIGETMAGVMHEINNPLGVITGSVELMLSEDFPAEKRREFLLKIYDSANRCRDIARSILAFTRKEAPHRQPINVNAVISRALDLKRPEFKKDRVGVDETLAPDLPVILADENQLQQVMLNLFNNAHHAMKEQAPDRHHLCIQTAFNDCLVRIRIQDTGSGIPRENLQKIFEPFFTSKARGQGTGLGLSLCYDIIRAHDGDIYVSSEPGKGACFIIELPIGTADPIEPPS
ncbi:MAG: response regulator [Desulfobacterales bacterium]|nr:response regulator [Desulfobacterales bacterium]